MIMPKIKHIKVSGTAYECGHQLGIEAKEEIRKTIKAYKKIFQTFNKNDWTFAQQEAEKYLPWIQQYDQTLVEEMQGISDGADVPFLDIVAINARSEIMSTNDGCTSLAAVPPSTDGHKTIVGQNWDWLTSIKGCLIVVEIRQTNRPQILMCTEAGIIGKIGMNNKGIGVCLNFLSEERQQYGVPVHVILRGILNSELYSQAVGQISRLPRGTAANYLIASKEGEALSVESTCNDYDAIYPNQDIITHSNHFYGPKSILIKDTSRYKFPDTHFRNGRAEKLLRIDYGQINEQSFKRVLSDHVNYPDSICRHGETLAPMLGREVPSDTLFSIIMNLSELRLEIAFGQSCCAPFSTFSL